MAAREEPLMLFLFSKSENIDVFLGLGRVMTWRFDEQNALDRS